VWDRFRYSDIVEAADGAIYFAAEDHLFALDASGGIRWQREFDGIRTLRVGADGTVYVVAAGSVIRLSHDGQVIWIVTIAANSFPIGRAPCAIDSAGAIYLISSTKVGDYWVPRLTKISPDGRVEWESPVELAENAEIVMGESREDGTEAVYLLYEHWGLGGVLAKFGRDGVRRWERIIPGLVNFGAENRQTFRQAVALNEREIAITGGRQIAIVEDRESAALAAVNLEVSADVEEDHLRLQARVDREGATNTWRFISPRWEDGDFIIWSAPIQTPSLQIPFSLKATNWVVEVDLPDAVLASPILPVHTFSGFSSVKLGADKIVLEGRSIPHLGFRCFASEDLVEWNFVGAVLADEAGNVRLEVDRSNAVPKFFRFSYP
jgi:hypothetical protein